MNKRLLQMRSISKRFGITQALNNVDLEVNSGEVVALIGENGAGKSTLMKVLSGAHPVDSGTMKLNGQPFSPSGPADSRRGGISMIYQELNLAPHLSVEDNLLLGHAGTGGGFLLRNRQRTRVRDALSRVGLADLNPRSVIGQQSVATQQLVEIARALIGNAKIILLDEPTSSLPQKDVTTLFRIVKELKGAGIGMVYISHFLEEVRAIADRFVVLRDGENAGVGKIEDVNDKQIISMMVGRDVDNLFPTVPHQPGEPWVELKNVSGVDRPQRVNLELRRGEILGISGLVGAGRTELLRTLFALDQLTTGQVYVSAKAIKQSISARKKAGFGLLSEDRKNEGLAQELSLLENITISSLNRYATLGFIPPARRRQAAIQLAKQVHVKTTTIDQSVAELSGGNQQKVAIARILHEEAEIFLLDEPTKGIDVGTKAEIYRMMGELAAKGKTVVFVSSYLPELLAVCDRIGVMARGELREVRNRNDWSKEQIMEAAIGGV